MDVQSALHSIFFNKAMFHLLVGWVSHRAALTDFFQCGYGGHLHYFSLAETAQACAGSESIS